MIKESKYFESNLYKALTVKAENLGLAKDFRDAGYFLGYHLFTNDDESKQVYGIALQNPGNGAIGLVMTRSENVIRQIDDIMEMIGTYPRSEWVLRFTEEKTQRGNRFIKVVLSVPERKEPAEHEIPFDTDTDE